MKVKVKANEKIYHGFFVKDKSLVEFNVTTTGTTNEVKHLIANENQIKAKMVEVEGYSSIYKTYEIDPDVIAKYGNLIHEEKTEEAK